MPPRAIVGLLRALPQALQGPEQLGLRATAEALRE